MPHLDDEEAIDRLEHDIRRLKIEFERFFNGSLKAPPEQVRMSISTQLHELRSRHIRAFSLRFRLSNLEARFHTFNVFFNRRLRDLEQGEAGGAVRAPMAAGPPLADARQGIVVGDDTSRDAVRALFRALYPADDQRPRADFDRFQVYLDEQVEKIRRKTGCSQVQFRVASEGGKLKLKAKPL